MSQRRLAVRGAQRGLTLIEVLVAIGILSMLTLIIYAAISGMKHSKEGIERISDRYREGRLTMSRLSRELQSAYISSHAPIDPSFVVEKTSFIARSGVRGSRLDFNSFSNRRLDIRAKESDQDELGYWVQENPELPGVYDLVRRIDTTPDLEPTEGGRVEVVATDVDEFELKFFDPTTAQWLDSWDSTQVTGQPNRVPLQVKVTLVLNGGSRLVSGRAREPVRLVEKISLPIQEPLRFATQ
jgi:general secretion pathway protein J